MKQWHSKYWKSENEGQWKLKWKTNEMSSRLPSVTALRKFQEVAQARETQAEPCSLPDWRAGARISEMPRGLQLTVQNTEQERAPGRKNTRDLQMLSPEYSSDYWLSQEWQQTTHGWGKNHPKRWEQTVPRIHKGLKILAIPQNYNGKPHTLGRIGQSSKKHLTSVVGKINLRLKFASIQPNKA